MHFDNPSDAKDARLAIAAFIARTKLDLTDAFGTMEREVEGDPVAFDQRSKKALDQYLTDLPAQLLPEQKQFLRDELEEDRGLMLNGLRTAALERDRTRHNADLARVADRFAADAETEARKLGFSGEVDGGFRALAVHQGLAKAELALSERTDLDDAQKQDFLAQARSRSAEAAVGGAFEAGLTESPDAAQKMIDDFLAMEAPEGIDKPTQEAIARRLGGRLRDARDRMEMEALTAETEAAVERAQTFTELLVGAGEGTVGHTEIQAANLPTLQQAFMTIQAEERMARERRRQEGRTLITRIIVGETDQTGALVLRADDPDRRAAVDDYFENVVIPGRGRVRGAATFIAATGMVPEAAETILAKALGSPPDLGSEPKRGPGPKEQAIVAGLVARIDAAAPGALDGIDPRIRARADAIIKLMRTGTAPEQAAQRADGLMAQAEKQDTDFDSQDSIGGAEDEDLDDDTDFGSEGDDQLAMGAVKEVGKALARKLFPEAARRMGRQIQRKLREKLNREAGAGRKKLAPDSKPVDPEKVVDAFGTALEAVNTARALKKLKPKKKAQITLEDLGTDDEAGAVQGFVEAWMEGDLLPGLDHTAQLNLGPVDPDFAARLKKDTGIDVSGLNDAIDTQRVGHAFNSHGPGRETDPTQEPISPEALSIYRQAVRNYDRVSAERRKGDGLTFTFEKDVNGEIVVVEQVRRGHARRGSAQKERGELAFFNMWIKKR